VSKSFACVAALSALVLPMSVSANSFSCSGLSANVLCWQPSPVDLNDLDHHLAYTWRINNISAINKTITSATLSFDNIANWDTSANHSIFTYSIRRSTQA